MFEIQAHPRTSAPRTRSAFLMLDSLIRSLGLTTLDVDDPRTTTFVPGAVPVVPASPQNSPSAFNLLADPSALLPGSDLGTYDMDVQVQSYFDGADGGGYEAGAGMGTYNLGTDPYQRAPTYAFSQMHSAHAAHPDASPYARLDDGSGMWQCGCSEYSLGANWPLAAELTPAWTNMPMWPREVEEGEGAMVKEECRRIAWSTLMLTVTHSTKTTAGTDREPQHLWIKDPANVSALLCLFAVLEVGWG